MIFVAMGSCKAALLAEGGESERGKVRERGGTEEGEGRREGDGEERGEGRVGRRGEGPNRWIETSEPNINCIHVLFIPISFKHYKHAKRSWVLNFLWIRCCTVRRGEGIGFRVEWGDGRAGTGRDVG